MRINSRHGRKGVGWPSSLTNKPMNIHLLQWHIYDVYPKFSQHKKIWKANGGSKFSQCAEISWIKIRMCLEVCQLLPPICYKKACRSKRNQLTHQRSFEPGPGDEATSQSCFESMGKKNMKKTNSLGLKYPKVVASFYIQKKIILKKPSLIKKKNGDWNIHPHENRQLQLGTPPSRWVGELRCEDRHLPMDHHQRLRFDSGRPGGAKGVNAQKWKA